MALYLGIALIAFVAASTVKAQHPSPTPRPSIPVRAPLVSHQNATKFKPVERVTTPKIVCHYRQRKPDLYDCKKYFECDAFGKWWLQECGWLKKYDYVLQTCKTFHALCAPLH